MGIGTYALALLLVVFAAVVAWTVVGIHALLLGRMPGRRLPRYVRQPRLWGLGASLVVVSWNAGSPSLCAIGVGLLALGHVVKSPD